MYDIIKGDDFYKRINGDNLEEFSISDYIEIQTYIESDYPQINYYSKSVGFSQKSHFSIVIHKDKYSSNILDIYKNSDEYFLIKSYIKLKDIHKITGVEFPGSHKYFVADQIDGLLLFIKDIIDVYLNKKENNIQKMLRSIDKMIVFDIVAEPAFNNTYIPSINYNIIGNNGERRLFTISL